MEDCGGNGGKSGFRKRTTKYYQFWKFGDGRFRHLDLGTLVITHGQLWSDSVKSRVRWLKNKVCSYNILIIIIISIIMAEHQRLPQKVEIPQGSTIFLLFRNFLSPFSFFL